MKPVMLHADRTECHHEGTPQATVTDDDGPRCAAGRPITHVRFNGHEMTIAEAAHALQNIADSFAKMLSPLIVAFSDLARQIGALEPTMRVLLAATQAAEEEMELDLDDEEAWPDQFRMTFNES